MNSWVGLGLAAGLLAASLYVVTPSENADPRWTLVIAGDADGSLSPCGCTSPMTGGIRRMAGVVRQIEAAGQTAFIDTGGFGDRPGIQTELKAQTLAETLAGLDVAGVNLTARDLALGANVTASIQSLAPGTLVSTNRSGWMPFVERGPFLIGGVSRSGADFDPVLDAARSLADRAASSGKVAVLMVDGPRSEAAALARATPNLSLIVYRLGGWPPDEPDLIGSVRLATPGEQGKAVVRIEYDGSKWQNYRVIRLGPEIPDDPEVSRFYGTYLRRVEGAHLLEALPRSDSPAYAGSRACASCHQGAYRIWAHTGHADAYRTLLAQSHGRDPDCVSCHVVGLNSRSGFHPGSATSDLAAVGCESCHGPAAKHAGAPRDYRLAKVNATTCDRCHTSEQSPNFRFLPFWSKIAHR